MTHSDKCIGAIERKVITDMRRVYFLKVKAMFWKHKLYVLDWPRNSLDLNSIETP